MVDPVVQKTLIRKIDDFAQTDRECSLDNAEVVPRHMCNGKQNCWVCLKTKISVLNSIIEIIILGLP